MQGTINRILPLVIMGSFSCLGGIAALFLPETLWRHLPNSLQEGESFGKQSLGWDLFRSELGCMGRHYILYLQVSTEEVRISIRDGRKKGLTET